ncbi:MAG: NAD(P)/FAD-dependent oxidoreductase [Pseudomonadota bacterium]
MSEPYFDYDVLIVGAGAAGVGVAIALQDAGIDRILVVDRYGIGASFSVWPEETRFITPSFPTNSVGMLDINSIAIGVSAAHSLRVEHPTGLQFAAHLNAVANYFALPVREGCHVTGVRKEGEGFVVETDDEPLRANHVIWAAGEFQYPRHLVFPGSEYCRHTATIGSYEDVEGNDVIVIGGYESGIDAAYHLAYYDCRVRVFDSGCPWESTSSDPSVALSPFTLERMREDWFDEQVELHAHTKVVSVTHDGDRYHVVTSDGVTHETDSPPLLAAGFEGGHSLVADLFELRPDGFPVLTDEDESTTTPGLFLCGPAVRHDGHVFCFIYKYRQRFAVVARAIANALDRPSDGLEIYRTWGMFLDDLSCCGGECVC